MCCLQLSDIASVLQMYNMSTYNIKICVQHNIFNKLVHINIKNIYLNFLYNINIGIGIIWLVLNLIAIPYTYLQFTNIIIPHTNLK